MQWQQNKLIYTNIILIFETTSDQINVYGPLNLNMIFRYISKPDLVE